MKKILKNLFLPRRFYTLYEKNSGPESPSFNYFSPSIPKSEKFGYWTLGSGGKKIVKQSEKHRYQKNPSQ